MMHEGPRFGERSEAKQQRPCGRLVTGGLLLGLLAGSAAIASAQERVGTFGAEMDRAMRRMMVAMDLKPSGDSDSDFVAMMVPHHQGAIDMAVAELRFGKDERLKRIAQEIIVEQQQEIAAMRLASGQSLPPSSAAPTAAQDPYMR